MASIAIIITYLWPLTRKRSLGMNSRQANARQAHWQETDSQAVWNGMTKQMHGCSLTNEGTFCTDAVKRIHSRRKFLNGCCRTDEVLTKIFWTDEVEWVNDWRKYFWTDERLKKWFFFERMWSNSQTTEENYNIILITILHQAPLQLYKIERLDHFLIWYYIEIYSVKNKVNLFSQQGNINHNVWACLLLFCDFKKTFCHATISTTCNAV